MPYDIAKHGNQWYIIRRADGKVVGKSDSKVKAEASIRARMSGESKKK